MVFHQIKVNIVNRLFFVKDIAQWGIILHFSSLKIHKIAGLAQSKVYRPYTQACDPSLSPAHHRRYMYM